MTTARARLMGEEKTTDGQPRCRSGEEGLGYKIVRVAREYLNTPFFHAGRTKGKGVDCVGLLICVAHELQLTTYDNCNYQPGHVDPAHLRRELDKFCRPIDLEEVISGDILVLKTQGNPQHVGIYCRNVGNQPETIIHANESVGRVVEDRFRPFWAREVETSYRWRS